MKEVGGAATEVYFHVARYVIKHGLDWYRTTEERSKSHDAMVAKEAGSVLASVGKKRKRKDKPSVPSGMGERVLVAQAWHAMLSCVTEVLDLWDEEVMSFVSSLGKTTCSIFYVSQNDFSAGDSSS